MTMNLNASGLRITPSSYKVCEIESRDSPEGTVTSWPVGKCTGGWITYKYKTAKRIPAMTNAIRLRRLVCSRHSPERYVCNLSDCANKLSKKRSIGSMERYIGRFEGGAALVAGMRSRPGT